MLTINMRMILHRKSVVALSSTLRLNALFGGVHMSFRNCTMAAALAVGLGGCASVNYIVNEYQGVTVQEVKMPDDTYRVFDKPAQNKMIVTSSLGSAAGQGFARGLTFGAAPTDPPKPLFEAAALQFLSENGRPGCRVLDAYLLARPQWEVKYDCAVAATTPAPQLRRRSS